MLLRGVYRACIYIYIHIHTYMCGGCDIALITAVEPEAGPTGV